MDPALRAAADAARGFMPADEGLALHQAAVRALGQVPGAPLVEVGSWCGKSALYLGAAARDAGSALFAVDHHRGSEENQAGWEHHPADLVDPATGLIDTLGEFRRTVAGAGLEPWVVAVVGDSATVARWWATPAALVFLDGGHGVAPARADHDGWVRWVAPGGILAVHDVFPDPADGGRPPYEEIYLPVVGSGRFDELPGTGSLRLLQRR